MKAKQCLGQQIRSIRAKTRRTPAESGRSAHGAAPRLSGKSRAREKKRALDDSRAAYR